MSQDGTGNDSGKIEVSKSILFPVIQSSLIFSIFEISLFNGTLIRDSNAVVEFYIFFTAIVVLPFLTYFFKRLNFYWYVYTNALEIFLYGLLIPVFLKTWSLVPFTILPFLISVLKIDRKGGYRWPYWKVAIFVTLSVIMYTLGGLLQIIAQPAFVPVVITPLKSIFIYPDQSLPPLFYLGMNIYGSFATITVSPLNLFVFALIASLVAENYEGFFRILNRNGKGGLKSVLYGVTAALSCQCEACISLLPAMIFIIITAVMIPLVLESLALLVLSNVLIRIYLSGRKIGFFDRITGAYSGKQIFLGALLIIVSTPVELIGIYLGWIRNPAFFFGMGMLGTLAGYVLTLAAANYLKLKENRFVAVVLISAGTLISLIWYYPSLTLFAFGNGTIFSVMIIASLVSGIFFGIAHKSLSNGYLVPEAVSLIYGLFMIALFYVTFDFRINAWPEFPFSWMALFEILAWAVMLPVMWFFTQMSIYRSSGSVHLFFSVEKPMGGSVLTEN